MKSITRTRKINLLTNVLGMSRDTEKARDSAGAEGPHKRSHLVEIYFS